MNGTTDKNGTYEHVYLAPLIRNRADRYKYEAERDERTTSTHNSAVYHTTNVLYVLANMLTIARPISGPDEYGNTQYERVVRTNADLSLIADDLITRLQSAIDNDSVQYESMTACTLSTVMHDVLTKLIDREQT